MAEFAEGPTALVMGFDDPIAPIKTLVEYQRTARNTFVARSAYLEGQVYRRGAPRRDRRPAAEGRC